MGADKTGAAIAPHMNQLAVDSCIFSLAHVDKPLLLGKTVLGVGPRASDSGACLAQGSPPQKFRHQADFLIGLATKGKQEGSRESSTRNQEAAQAWMMGVQRRVQHTNN